MRNACGSNDHSDPILFIQVFKLMCCYSLVNPAKGSTVEGTELLETLINTKDSIVKQAQKKALWAAKIDEVLDENTDAEASEPTQSCSSHLADHTYDTVETCCLTLLLVILKKKKK